MHGALAGLVLDVNLNQLNPQYWRCRGILLRTTSRTVGGKTEGRRSEFVQSFSLRKDGWGRGAARGMNFLHRMKVLLVQRGPCLCHICSPRPALVGSEGDTVVQAEVVEGTSAQGTTSPSSNFDREFKGQERKKSLKRIQQEEDAIKRSRSVGSEYELSIDLQHKQIELLERKYGGHFIANRAARVIQRAFRHYCMTRNFQKLRNAQLENRMSRRIDWQTLRLSTIEVDDDVGSSLGRGVKGHGAGSRSMTMPAVAEIRETSLLDMPEEHMTLTNVLGGAAGSRSRVSSGSMSRQDSYRLAVHPDSDLSQEATPEHSMYSAREMVIQDQRALIDADYEMTLYVEQQKQKAADGHSGDSGIRMSRSSDEGSGSDSTASRSSRDLSDLGEVSHEAKVEMRPVPSVVVDMTSPARMSPDALMRRGSPQSGRRSGTPEASPVWKHKQLGRVVANGAQRSAGSDVSDGDNDSQGSSSNTPDNMSLSSETISLSGSSSIHGVYKGMSRDSAVFTPINDVQRKRQYRIGLNLFNKKPEKGIAYLVDKGFLQHTPQAVAKFLLSRRGLSRQMIGEYLGNCQKDFNRDVLDCVVDEMDFADLELDEALRKFQSQIRVQGEAQKVERLIEAFSQRYCICNPSVVHQFNHPDTIFILAFAIIMLNTDLHNPNIKRERKMKQENFVENLKGVDAGGDIPREILVGIYERISKSELKTGPDHVTQVAKVEKNIVGNKPIWSVPTRALVSYSHLNEVHDVNKKEKEHERALFLFNDLLVVTKILAKKKHVVTYSFRQAFSLLGMQVLLFETSHYQYGVRLTTMIDNKVLMTFNAPNAHDREKFVQDLRECILEVNEMENLRIGELMRQQSNMSVGNYNTLSTSDIHQANGGPVNRSFDDTAKDRHTLGADSALKRTALSNSLRDITEATGKRGRRNSAGSLDSNMIPSGRPEPSMKRSESEQDTTRTSLRHSNSSLFGGLFSRKHKSTSKASMTSIKSDASVGSTTSSNSSSEA
ncbi:PREDICTED: IQ motif and SEC7 domain-containing protein 2-like isoform X2 [Branchiostoma belcheri]|uniref:IQ motif and SEC7 domain-containing protein 2-like isoform X2 n=1 Tax=Branchiostoma belcheri TaxID=7741 RepID=A0A6P4ZWS2_BRABE|nr:PREDICTED: IQ motif and SEC7 domain-containing protein 2-like isoform X2 [Branchiostoma belcheri]